MTTPEQRFEDRLLAELRAVVAERPAPAPPQSGTAAASAPPRRAPRLTRSRVAIGAAATAAATAAVAVVLAAGGTSTPAYAVEPAADGGVTVEITSLRDAAGLERKLREAGVPAVVRYVPEGKTCRARATGGSAPSRGAAGAAQGSMGVELRDGAARFTISRGMVGRGETLVIVSSLGQGVSSVATTIADGPVPPCELVDAAASGGGVEAVPVPPGGAGAGGAGSASPAEPSLRQAPEAGTDGAAAGGTSSAGE